MALASLIISAASSTGLLLAGLAAWRSTRNRTQQLSDRLDIHLSKESE